MTTTFAFDASTTRASCALLRDGELLAERICEPRGLLSAAHELAGSVGLPIAQVEELVVGTGPGSFTSIRVALATARALALALGARAAGVSTLEAFAGGTVVLDVRRGEVATAGPRLSRPEELAVDGSRLIGDGALRYRALFEAAGAEVPPEDDRAHLPSAARLAARAVSFGDAELIEPLYLREPDARASR